jgi:hypothetical protein
MKPLSALTRYKVQDGDMSLTNVPTFSTKKITGYRLINAKLPPIYLFEDVASADEFEDLYAIQALTNPRLQNEVENISLLELGDVPWGIGGCNYAVGSFTHVNPDGSRFSDGSYGVMYMASKIDTAIEEVKYHQQRYWEKVNGLAYERFVFRQLICAFSVRVGLDAKTLPITDPIYRSEDYSQSRGMGARVRKDKIHSVIRYHSVRKNKGVCYALFTPKEMKEVVPSAHYEMIWDGNKIASTNKVSLT